MTFEMYPSGMIERFWTIEAVRPMRHLLHGLHPSHMLLFFWVLCMVLTVRPEQTPRPALRNAHS